MGKERLVRQVFGTSVPSIGDLRVVGYSRATPLSLVFGADEDVRQRSGCEHRLHFAIHADEGDDLYRMVCHVTWKLVLGEIAAPFDASDVAPSVGGEPVFLPASRAGLMVAFRPLVGDGGGWGQVLNLLICVRHGPIRACRRSYMGAALAAPPSPRCLSCRSGGNRD